MTFYSFFSSKCIYHGLNALWVLSALIMGVTAVVAAPVTLNTDRVADGNGVVDSADIAPPFVNNLSFSADYKTPYQGVLQAPAPRPYHYHFTYSLVTQPLYGTITLDAKTGKFTYTSEATFTGEDHFTFQVYDGVVYSNVATANVAVAYDPLLVVTTLEDVEADDDKVSLREAIFRASYGTTGLKTVTFAPGLHGSLVLKSMLIVDRALSIVGPGASQLSLTRDINGPKFSLLRIGGMTATPENFRVDISSLNFTNGDSDMDLRGGAIHARIVDLRLNDCSFENNIAGYGGAVYGRASVTLRNCFFGSNNASLRGGAVFGQNVTATQCTFWNNVAPLGGGICTSYFNVEFCTFVANRAEGSIPFGHNSGGGLYSDYGGNQPANTDNLSHCLFAGNITGSRDPDFSADANATYNLFGIGYFGGNGNIPGADAKLDPAGPKLNGGETKTIAILAGSAAINAGKPSLDTTNLPYDQRGPGYSRKNGSTVDMGAFEYLNESPVLEDATFTFLHGQSITSAQLEGSDVNGDTLVYSTTSPLPAGITLRSSGSFSGTPTTLTPAGGVAITVQVTDGDGASDTARVILHVNDLVKPTVAIRTPYANQKILISKFTPGSVTGTASDNLSVTKVTVKLIRKRGGIIQTWDGTAFTSASVSLPAIRSGNGTNVNWSLNNSFPPAEALDAGAYTIQAFVIDASRNITNKSINFTLFASDTEAPVALIATPTQDQKVLLSEFTAGAIKGSASDNIGVASVRVRLSRRRGTTNYYWNGTAFTKSSIYLDIPLKLVGATSLNWNFDSLMPGAEQLDAGLYQLDAYAFDLVGAKSATVVRKFTLNTEFTAPSVSITSPTAGQSLSINAFGAGTMRGIARDNVGVARVKVKLVRKRGGVDEYWNGTAFTSTPAGVEASLSVTGGTNVTWSLDNQLPTAATGLDLGTYTVYASAYDTAGNYITPGGRSFTLTGTVGQSAGSAGNS